MSTQYQTLKGFRDFIGKDSLKRAWLINLVKEVFSLHGFEPLETPALEYKELLAGKYGAEAEKLIYAFEDHGGRQVALRYDQTVPSARVIASNQRELNFPFRRFQVQPVWRADKPQRGRYREFFQCDADIFGSPDSIADAEILKVFYAIFEKIGIGSIKIKVNHRQQLIGTIKNNGVADDLVLPAIQSIDKLDKKSKEDVCTELTAKGVQNPEKLIDELLSQEPTSELRVILQQANALGVPESVFQYVPTLARGLDYYTGLIFEGSIPEYTVGSIGGGGRYDNLINDLVGFDCSAVGFGLGFDRTLEAAEELGCIPTEYGQTQALVCALDKTTFAYSADVAQKLREKSISTDVYPSTSIKLDKVLRYASKKEILYVILIGSQELENKTITIKNMLSHEQQTVSLKEIYGIISK